MNLKPSWNLKESGQLNPKWAKVEDAPDLRHQGRSRSRLLQALDNEEDGVSSAFPTGKQNGIFFINLYLIHRRIMKMHLNLLKCIINQIHKIFFLFCLRSFRVKKITYKHLINFVADHKATSIHVRKSRVRSLRQFFHFLTLHHL